MKKLNPYSQLLIRMSLVLFIVVTATFLNRTDATARAESADKGYADFSAEKNADDNASGMPGSSFATDTNDTTDPGNPQYRDGLQVAELSGDTGNLRIGENSRDKDPAGNGGENEPGNPASSADVTNAGNVNGNGPGNSGNVDGNGPGNTGNVNGNGQDNSGDVNGNGPGNTGNESGAPGNGNDPEGREGISDNGQNNGLGVEGDGDDDFDIRDQDNVQNANVPLSEEELKAIAEAEEAQKLAEYKKTQEYINTLLVTHPDHYNAEVVKSAKSLPLASDNDRYLYITGKDKKVYKVGGMPEGYRNDPEAKTRMVTLDVPVWKMNSNGEKYSSYWPITINEKLADSIRCIFSDIYLLDIKFPFNYLIGYSYRKVGGVGLVNSKLMSTHAFGVALDINLGDFDNDYFLGKGNDLRNKKNPYCIPDEVIRIFESYGWFWGGNYEICADTMHFQYFELGFLKYDSDEPFPILSRNAEEMDPKVIRNLTQRLVKLGYLEKETQSFSKKVDKAVKKFQEEHGLEADGVVDYETWEPLINLTHYMAYVF